MSNSFVTQINLIAPTEVIKEVKLPFINIEDKFVSEFIGQDILIYNMRTIDRLMESDQNSEPSEIFWNVHKFGDHLFELSIKITTIIEPFKYQDYLSELDPHKWYRRVLLEDDYQNLSLYESYLFNMKCRIDCDSYQKEYISHFYDIESFRNQVCRYISTDINLDIRSRVT